MRLEDDVVVVSGVREGGGGGAGYVVGASPYLHSIGMWTQTGSENCFPKYFSLEIGFYQRQQRKKTRPQWRLFRRLPAYKRLMRTTGCGLPAVRRDKTPPGVPRSHHNQRFRVSTSAFNKRANTHSHHSATFLTLFPSPLLLTELMSPQPYIANIMSWVKYAEARVGAPDCIAFLLETALVRRRRFLSAPHSAHLLNPARPPLAPGDRVTPMGAVLWRRSDSR